MKKTFFILLVLSLCFITPAYAFTVYDPINSALNQFRNMLLENHQWEKLRLMIKEIQKIKDTYQEVLRLNLGVDDIPSLLIGGPSQLGASLSGHFGVSATSLRTNTERSIQTLFETVEGIVGGDLSSAYFDIFKKIPIKSPRTDLIYEDLRIANALQLSGQIIKESKKTRQAGERISRQAITASAKGALRLSADSLGKILQTQSGIHENQARVVELMANSMAKVAMEDKTIEGERLKFIRDIEEVWERIER